jgi:hypothetical protein
MPAPRFATARNLDRQTYGPAVGRVAQLRGRPLMPWQQLVADVGGRSRPARTVVYPLVVVTVQRQAGKTDLDLCQSVQRALQGPKPARLAHRPDRPGRPRKVGRTGGGHVR